MTENQMDSGEPVGTPNQQASDSDSSKDAAKLQSTLETVLKRVEEIDKAYKTFQSGKDRGANESKKAIDEVTELKRKIAEIEKLKKSGLDEDGAIEELSFRDDIRTLKDQLSKLGTAQTQTAGNGEGLAVDVAKVFGERGLDLKDPQVALVANMKYASPQEAELAAYKLRDRLASTPTHNPAQDVSIVGKQTSPQTVDALTKQYQSDMIANRGKPDALRKVKEQAVKNGVPVDSVSFT